MTHPNQPPEVKVAVEIDPGAMMLAHQAFLETRDTAATGVANAVWAYLWALQNVREQFGMEVYPSLNELREALAAREEST